jgi:hypothetical protein
MPLELKIGIINNDDNIIISDDTGNYNAISNPGGWDATGVTNPAHTTPTPVSVVSLDIYLPGTTTALSPSSNLLTTTFFTTTDRAYNLFTDPSAVVPTFALQDGVWKFVVNFTISGLLNQEIKYALRTNVIRCSIGKLALGNMDMNNFEEAKLLYDKMVQAFECEDYTLAQELYEEINYFFTDCSPYSINSCGC